MGDISTRLRQHNHHAKADALDALANDWDMGTVSLGEYATHWWRAVKVLQREEGL